MRCAVVFVALCATSAAACSSAAMNNNYSMSIHTMDLPHIAVGPVFFEWQIITVPKGTKGVQASTHGYVGIFPLVKALEPAAKAIEKQIAVGGMNDAGLTCGAQVLHSQYPKKKAGKININVAEFCRWVFEGFDSVAAVKVGLQDVNFIGPFLFSLHFVVRDVSGASLIVEFLNGETLIHDDLNDGVNSFGIMTNDPPFDWQVANVKHFQWKQGLARAAVAMPGSWYPDERFVRLHLVKSGMPTPASYEEAMMQAVHTLNTVTVPMGKQLGTDASGDHTQFGTVYDHANKVIYWRTQVNHNLQRLRLDDAGIGSDGTKKYLPVYSEKLPWFNDAAGSLAPLHEGITV